MDFILTADDMKRADAATMEHFHVPSCVLMERAALCVYEEMVRRSGEGMSVLIVCGTGNNGGDGLALARMLKLRGDDTDVVVLGDRSRASEEAARQMEILSAYDVPLRSEIPDREYDWVVDAVFGISLSRDVGGIYADAIARMNEMSGKKLAVDISSGICADTGRIRGCAFRADITVTMAYAKYGQLLYPGKEYTGELVIAQIGITDESFLDDFPKGYYYDRSDLALIPPRRPDSNKGTYGKMLSVTGSQNMAGAALFASKAAYRVGAGLVYIETPEVNREILQMLLPEAVLYTYWNGSTAQIREHVSNMTSAVCGCGLGTGEDGRFILESLLLSAQIPLVLDADALNLIAKVPRLRELVQTYESSMILTPHVGEAARLLECTPAEIKEDPVYAAQEISDEYNCICVLKDAVTVITDGEKIYLNTSGTSAMSKGGSGDVLTGVIGGLLAQGAQPWTAATVGVYLHGLAGEEAAEKTGTWSMLATDLTDSIGTVLSSAREDSV